jgi:outer membrane lipoprotein SlyB
MFVQVHSSERIQIMLCNKGFFALLLATSVGLTACVPPPPRQTVIYHESDQSNSSNYCQTCGTVRDVARVQIQQGTTGGGAVLGAIIGGLIGNQFGGGSGKAAATAVGVVGGAAVGNSVEASNAQAASGSAWRFRVQLDDGRMATVTQYDNPGFRPGNRVVIRGDHIEALPQ